MRFHPFAFFVDKAKGMIALYKKLVPVLQKQGLRGARRRGVRIAANKKLIDAPDPAGNPVGNPAGKSAGDSVGDFAGSFAEASCAAKQERRPLFKGRKAPRRFF